MADTVISEDALRTLEELPAFRKMPDEVRQLVLDAFEPVSFAFGTVIVREGDEADAFYVLVSGSARVVKRAEGGEEVPLGLLARGDTFGEIGLLTDAARSATVRATEPVEACRLERGVFRALVRRNPEVAEAFQRLVHLRTIRTFLRLHSAFAALPAEGLAEVAEAVKPVPIAAGELVIREGDAPGSMYVIEQGRLRAFTERDGRQEDLEYLRRGDFFGERSLVLGEPRISSVEATSDSRLLELTPELFRRLLEEHSEFRARVEERAMREDFLERVARVPLDFAEEILPAEAADTDKVSPAHVEAAPEFAEQVPELAPLPPARRRRRRRPPHVYQLDEMDCGAACTAMITRFFGKHVSLPRIRELVHTSSDGTSLLGIARGAEALGLEANAVRASKSRLDRLLLPAVCHWEGNHWIVLYEVSDQHVRIGDPATGIRRLTREEFEEKWTGYTVLFTPTPAFEELREDSPNYRWLGAFLRPHRGALAKAIALAFFAAGLELSIPILTQVVIDDAIPESDQQLLVLVLLGMLAAIGLMVGATILQRYILSFVAVRIDTEALDYLTARLLALPMSYFSTRRTGDIERRLAGIRQVRQFLIQSGVEALTATALLIAALVLMFVYSWQLALVYLAVVPLYALLMRYSAKRLRPTFESLEEAYGRYTSQQIDAIRGIETVKALAAEEGFRRQLLARFTSLADRLFRSEFLVMTYQGAIQFVTLLSLALFLFAGGLLVIDGQLTVGQFVAFNTLVLLANGPVLVLLALWDDLQYGRILLDRLADVIEHEPEQGVDRDSLRKATSIEGAIRLRNVGFQYGGARAPVILEDIELDVPPGQRVAIVGRSGSGKTTLVKLLAGLLEPTAGKIEIDGVDLQTLDYRSVRRQVGFVLQENHLFDDTIAANIAFGEEPDPGQVVWAAKLANAHEFVERLPLGYETRIGETGLRLSGGQNQRIAIARAVYHRPPVLLMDEASSALDSESERAVQQNLAELLAGRTTFVIAHRLSTIRDADVIVVLERGRIVERGTHVELLDGEGLYAYLIGQQIES